MDGCAPDDPNRLDTAEQLVALLRTVGFLPLFSNAIPGFSVEERVPVDRWWTDEESDAVARRPRGMNSTLPSPTSPPRSYMCY